MGRTHFDGLRMVASVGPGTLDPSRITLAVETALSAIEARVLSLIQDGARGTKPLDDVVTELVLMTTEIRSHYVHLQDLSDRRDLTFEGMAGLEVARKRCLWLYRKTKLERCFFAKLQLERCLRDDIYRQIVETWQEMSSLEEAEREARAADDATIAAELLKEANFAT